MRKRVISTLLVICLVSTFFQRPAVIQAAASTEDQVPPAVVFEDTVNHWAGEAASKLATNGIMTGYKDGRFHLDNPITRAEMATILNRIFQYTEKGTISFSDVSVSSWYGEDVLKVQKAGIVEGYADGKFMPNASILRQDGFLMLSRAFHMEALSEKGLSSFSDGDKVSLYARAAVASMVAGGYVKGNSSKKLNPQGMMTRAELAVILNQMIGWISPGSGEYSPGVVKGSVIINRPGALLKNSTITGSLYVTEGVGEGEFKANNITASGSTFITGGGVNSVIFEKSKLATVFLNKKSGPLRLALNDSSSVESVTLAQKAKIEVSAGSHLAVLTIGPDAAGSSIINKGTIGLLEVKAENVQLNGSTVDKGSYHKLSNVSQTATPAPTPGSNSAVATNEPVITPTSTPATTPTNEPVVTPTSTPIATPTNAPTVTPSWPPTGDDMWEMVWNDEFDSGSIDTNKWNIENTGTVYNNELEYYHPNNASIEKESGNDVLALEAKKESYQGRDYTSAKLTSKMKGDWTYGKFSIRAKLPIQQGMWPAIWMMPTDEFYQYGPWPGSGEMDIMELTGPKADDPANADKYPRTVHGSLHYNIPHIAKSEKYLLPEGQTFADDYHEFTLEWLPGLIRYYVDGEMYFETSDWGTKGDGQPADYTYPAPFDRPFYMILNLAVGGDWPGDPKNDFVSDKMYVDYVRVYEYKDMHLWPDVTGKRPENTNVTQQRPSLPDGNQIYNGDFTGEIESSGVPENWQFIVNEGGQGSVSVVDDPEKGKISKVTIDSPGTVNYSIQLTQMPLMLEKGKTYKVTFDAKADAARSLMSKLTEFGGGWTPYSKEHTFQLTNQWQTYEYTFQMKDSSDNNVRFEFNLGQNAIASYFTNVKVVETDPVVEIRKPLADGNWIYNGKFELGKDRMEFWDFHAVPEARAVATVTNKLEFPQMDRKLNVNVQNEKELDVNAVTLSQGSLPLTPGSSYQLSFDGRADRDLQIQVSLDTAADNADDPEGSVIHLTTETKSFSKEIHVDESTTGTSTLQFLLGKYTGQVEIDNVRLVLNKNQSSHAGYIHMQADNYFAQSGTETVSSGEGTKDISGMEEGDYVDYKLDIKAAGSYVPMIRVASEHEDAELKFTILDESLRPVVTEDTYAVGNTGGVHSYRTIIYNPTSLSTGIYYLRLSGQNYNLAWLDMTREMVINGGFDSGEMTGWTLFKKDWVANDPVKNTTSVVNNNALEIKLGGTGDEPWNVQVKQPGMPLEKGNTYILSFNAHSSIDRSIVALVQHDGSQDEDWTAYLEQRAVLSGENDRFEYIFTALENEPSAVLQFSLGKIDEILGEHSVVLDNISLLRINPVIAGTQPEQPENKNLLPNGDFSSGISGWSVYSKDNDQLSIGSTDESLEITVGSVGEESWHRQVYYEGITYNQGDSYTLTFKAKATTSRKMNVSIGWSDAANNYTWIGYTSKIIDLGTDEQTYTIDFVATDSTAIGRVSFELGNIEGGASSDLSVFIDDITLVKK